MEKKKNDLKKYKYIIFQMNSLSSLNISYLTINELDTMLKTLENNLKYDGPQILKDKIISICQLIKKLKIRTCNGKINKIQTKDLISKYDLLMNDIGIY
jgi:hypothetical protein